MNCTRYQLKHVLLLRSFHSFRIYELLKQYEKIGQRVFSVDELKNILRIEDKYKRYNDFKKDVLIKAQEDLKKHTDIRFEFFEKKKGRKINQITFFIARNVPDEELSLESDEEVDKILSLLNNQLSDDKQVSKSVLVQIIEKHPKSYDEIEKIIKNITFKDSFSVVETLVAAFKGTYIVDDKKTREEEWKKAAKQRKMLLEEEKLKKEIEKKAEQQRLDKIFTELPLDKQKTIKETAVARLKENSPPGMLSFYKKQPKYLEFDVMPYLRDILRNEEKDSEQTYIPF